MKDMEDAFQEEMNTRAKDTAEESRKEWEGIEYLPEEKQEDHKRYEADKIGKKVLEESLAKNKK